MSPVPTPNAKPHTQLRNVLSAAICSPAFLLYIYIYIYAICFRDLRADEVRHFDTFRSARAPYLERFAACLPRERERALRGGLIYTRASWRWPVLCAAPAAGASFFASRIRVFFYSSFSSSSSSSSRAGSFVRRRVFAIQPAECDRTRFRFLP